MVVISNHNIISNDAQLAPRYLVTQEHAISHFQNTLRLLGTKRQQAFQRRQNNLPHSLRIRECHFPKRLRNALERTPLYKKAMQRLKINWIGLKLSPPLLLGLLEGKKEEEERKQWEEIEKNAGFYPQEETPSTKSWDVKEATRAMKDMDIDN